MSTDTTPTITATDLGGGLERLTCSACPGWWNTATSDGERAAAEHHHLADHRMWAEQDEA